jgi:aminomethyltransferase
MKNEDEKELENIGNVGEALKTPLYDEHVKLGGRMVEFAGYLLPVQYQTGVIAEHNAVRARAGLFDVSHMGELVITGEDALANVQYILTNDFQDISIGQARYSPMCNESGGIIDDLIVYKLSEISYMLVVNASNKQKDFDWITENLFGDAELENISDSLVQISMSGPESEKILLELADKKYIPKKNYTFIEKAVVSDVECIVSRTGYTGEDGFEFYCSNLDGVKLWNLLLETGAKFGLIPCGLGARDTLRMEAGMPLYGHEMNDNISPLEAGLSHFVNMNKSYFIGLDGILERGVVEKVRVGLKLISRGIVREESKLYFENMVVGETTSGNMAPYLGYAISMAMVEKRFSNLGNVLEADVRGNRLSVEVVETPFYKRTKIKI